MTLIQTEPKSIKIGIPHDDYSAIQGPCPDGYHIPTKDEWVSIRGIFSAFGIQDGTTFGTYLKMPRAGYRYYPNSNVNGSGDYGYYWSCTASTTPKSYCLMFHQYSIFQQYEDYRADGFNIRGFKDTPVTPDGSWTTIYQGSGNAGIFWNATLGLISLSSNGTTWITIADKNLGATTVYNYGDTLAEANCGYYYQWGNNYGFAFSGYLYYTSSSQVDASTYGPGNYYNSSTFIYSNQERSSVPNSNLRGGVTGMVQKADTDIKKVYLGSTLVRPPFKPRTFTISWTEQSNMSSGWTYSDDAAGLTAGSGDFDDFFGYSAVLLNTSGVETAEMTQSGGVFTGAMTTLGNITSGDNVMIKFPVRGIKMSKSGSVVTLSITDGLGREDEGYQYYAFNRSGTIKDKMYLGAYKGARYNDNGTYKLKSWSGQGPSSSTGNGIRYIPLSGTSLGAREMAHNEGGTGTNGYDSIAWYQRQYINALYMMKYGNPDSQSVVGKGFSSTSTIPPTGGTNSQTSATYGTSSTTTQMKLFGLEDRWGNIYEWIDGAFYTSTTNLNVSSNNVLTGTTWSGGVFNTNVTVYSASPRYLSAIVGTNDGMFSSAAAVGSNYSYYCDSIRISSGCAVLAGGYNRGGDDNGAFCLDADTVSSAGSVYGARLMYL